VIEASVVEHSVKPAVFAEMIERYFPTTRKLAAITLSQSRVSCSGKLSSIPHP
jgi:hypothetical protein